MSTQTNTNTGETLQLVSFCINKDHYAVDILSVQEINRMLEITEVPESPAGIEGVINLRGRIIPVMDLRTRFSLPPSERTEESRIVVVNAAGSTVGFIVDRVYEVLRINSSTVEPSPTLSNGVNTKYISGVAKRDDHLVILLDVDELLGGFTAQQLSQIAA